MRPVSRDKAAHFAVTVAAQPGTRSGATCSAPPRLDCPEANCPVDQVRAEGNAVEPNSGRKFFLDYPCDLKPNEEVTFVLSLHGAGSIGNWQRHYFPIVDLKEKYRLVIATPTAATSEPTRRWVAEADDAYLQNVVDVVFEEFDRKRTKSFWLAGHSQGGITSRRIICSEYFKTRVDGWLSLSGGIHRSNSKILTSKQFKTMASSSDAVRVHPAMRRRVVLRWQDLLSLLQLNYCPPDAARPAQSSDSPGRQVNSDFLVPANGS